MPAKRKRASLAGLPGWVAWGRWCCRVEGRTDLPLLVVCEASGFGRVLCERWPRELVREWTMDDQIAAAQAILARLGPGDLRKTVAGAVPIEELCHDCPTVHALLTCPVDPEGRPRVTASLLAFFEDGHWKAVLHDRQVGRQLWVSARFYSDLCHALEERLTADPVDWRRARQWGREGPRKGSS